MQFLAFLKDSYREAKSGWMLQIMLVLSVVLILLVFSIGFHPITLQKELGDHISIFNRLNTSNSQRFEDIGRPEISVENFSSSNPSEPWNTDYAFDYVVSCPTPEDMKKAKKARVPITRSEVQTLLRNILPYINNLQVSGGPPELEKLQELEAKEKEDTKKEPTELTLPKEVRYKVTTRGSKAEDRLAWRHQVSVLFVVEIPYAYTSLREGVYLVEKWLVNGAGSWILLFVSIIITAGFIPSMLGKGSLDLMVSKPIGRVRLLLYKYVGGLLFILILTTFTVLGVWFAIGLRAGVWSPNFLAIIPILTFYFAVLYAVSTTVAVFTRNTLVAILVTGLAWGALWAVGKVNDGVENRLEQQAKVKVEAGTPEAVLEEVKNDQPLWGVIPKVTFPFITAIHIVTPRTYQLDDRLGRLIAEGVLTPNQMKTSDYNTPVRSTWIEMLLVSLLGIGVLLTIACWRFASRDY